MKPDNETNNTTDPPEAVKETSTDTTDPLEVLKAENEQLKTQMRLDRALRQMTGELEKAGARSPELLFGTIAGELQFGEEGEVVNSAALLDELKSRFPEQFGRETPRSIDGGAGQFAGPRLSKEALRRMKPSEIAELDWADVRRVLAG